MMYLTKKFDIWSTRLLTALLLVSLVSCTIKTETPPIQRTIEVTGSAEMAVQPDEIKVAIVLRTNSNRDRKKELLKILENNGIPEDKITFESSNTNHWWWYYSRYYDNTIQRFIVTLDANVNALDLMNDLKKPWVEQISITDRSNSQLQAYRRQVKTEAINAAKEKAFYMLEALDEELGSVITITEINGDKTTTTPYYYWNQSTINNTVSNSVLYSDQSGYNTIDGIETQLLRYEVNVVFSIKEKL